MQWAPLTPQLIVVATDQRAWLHRPLAIGDPFDEPMTTSRASVASTQKLLDGALAAARQSLPVPSGRPLTALRWAWRLAFQYHTSHATPRLLAEAAQRFGAMGRPGMAESCERKRDEESGHDTLALRDLRALGYREDNVVAACQPPTAMALIEYFESCVRSDEPVKLLGYSYALERSAMAIPAAYLDAVQALMPEGVVATRCLRVHCAVGTDPRHVAEDIELIATLPAAERAAIARSCYETAIIMHTVRDGDDPPEEALAQALEPLRTPLHTPA
jgi:hypothetical protein